MTLPGFLLARIAEDEREVDEIPDWYCTDSARGEGWGSRGGCPLCDRYMFDGTESVTKDAFWEHYEDVHKRRRVLAECKAKRRIVVFADPTEAPAGEGRYVATKVLTLLALPYADHPDYQEDWR